MMQYAAGCKLLELAVLLLGKSVGDSVFAFWQCSASSVALTSQQQERCVRDTPTANAVVQTESACDG